MTVNETLVSALKDIAPVRSGEYKPKDNAKEVYLVFNYYSIGDDFKDDEPGHEVYSVQVHLFCPSGMNSISKRRTIKKKLHEAGFTWPSSLDASDADGQHIVFECMIAGEVGEE